MPLYNPISNSDLIHVSDLANNFISDKVEGVLAELAGFHKPKYGVTGVGGITVGLTRLWDSVGKTAAVGTNTQTAINHFDSLAPFNRRKCVGDWAVVNGKGVFTVNSYYGDPDFAEDGTMGNYVAVEIEPFWYYQDDFSQDNPYSISGTLGVSPAWRFGWKLHPICANADGTAREKTYLPCYSLVKKDGVACSLPGYHPEYGPYYTLLTAARTYNAIASLESSIVRHYEWLLFTIEFATTNCQAIMAGASDMPYSASHVITLDGTGVNSVVVAGAHGDLFTVGQTIYIGATYSTTPASNADYNIITAIEKCLADGTPDGSGTFRKITFSGAARTVVASATTISSRPWITGACNTILTPSGCPSGATAPASASKYPARYRYRENTWGNIYSTLGDLFAKLEGAGTPEDPYKLEWYYLTGAYTPADVNKPNAADLASAAFVKLPQTTEHVSGSIKTIAMDDQYPEVITPAVQTGGGATSYYCDYGHIVNGVESIRAVRLGGYVYYGSYDGLLYFAAGNAPANGYWHFGGGLFLPQ